MHRNLQIRPDLLLTHTLHRNLQTRQDLLPTRARVSPLERPPVSLLFRNVTTVEFDIILNFAPCTASYRLAEGFEIEGASMCDAKLLHGLASSSSSVPTLMACYAVIDIHVKHLQAICLASYGLA
eukprot:1155817-Pelagomonas_calceolata.AAC.2